MNIPPIEPMPEPKEFTAAPPAAPVGVVVPPSAAQPAVTETLDGAIGDAIHKNLETFYSGSPQPQQSAAQPQQPQPQQPASTAPAALSLSAAPVTSDTVAGQFAAPKVAEPAAEPDASAAAQPAAESTEAQPPEGFNDQQAHAWAALRAQARQAREAARRLQQENEGLRRQSEAIAAEKAKLAEAARAKEDKVHELEEHVGKVDLSQSPEFKARYDKPLESIYSEIGSLIHDNAANADGAPLEGAELQAAVERVATSDDAGFQSTVQSLPQEVQGALLLERQKINRISVERENALADWRKTRSGLEQSSVEQQVLESSRRRSEQAEKAIEAVTKLTPPDQRIPVLSIPFFADDVKNTIEGFKARMQTATDDELALAACRGAFVPVLQRALAKALEEKRQVEDAYYSIRGAVRPPVYPTAGSVAAPPPPPPPPKPAGVSSAIPTGSAESELDAGLRQELNGFFSPQGSQAVGTPIAL